MTDKLNNICYLPWNVMNVYGREKNSPCSRIYPKQPGNAFDMSLKDIYNQPYYKELREQFLRGERPKICNACWAEEDAGVKSYRHSITEYYSEALQHHEFDKPVPRIIDLAFNPYCNAACIMCDSGSSDKWYNLDKEMSSLNNNIFNRKAIKHKNIEIKWTPEDFANIQHVKFGNNEAMLDPDFKPFLDKLNKYNNVNNVTLTVVTNASYIPKQSILDLLRQFKKIILIISLDAVEEQSEYIRYPLKWDNVLKSVYFWCEFSKNTPNFHLHCHTTMSIFNVFDLQSVTNFWNIVSKNIITTHLFRFVRQPPYLNPQILPKNIKKEVMRYNPNNKMVKMMQIDKENADQELEKFFKFAEFMDKKRNLDYTQTFPKLAHLLQKEKNL